MLVDAAARIVDLSPQPAVAVRVRTTLATVDLGSEFAHHIPRVARALADRGATPAGPPYGRYHEWGPVDVELEIGMPVEAPVESLPDLDQAADGEPGNSQLPGGRAALATHRGPYDGLAQATKDLHNWVAEQGLQPCPGLWESYVDDPERVPLPELRTELYVPLGP